MNNTIDRIRQANQQRTQNEESNKLAREQVQSNTAVQSAIFDAFRLVTDMVSNGQMKTSQIFRIIEELDGKFDVSKTQLEVLKAGLSTLEEQLKDLPLDDMKKLPKFLERPDSMKIKNLDDLGKFFTSLEKSIKSMKLDVKAPVVNVPEAVVHVPAPVVNVDAPDMTPVSKGLQDVTKAVKANKHPDVVKTEQTNTLISEKFDSFKIVYDDDFDDSDDPDIEAIKYYMGKKLVATIKYEYKDGQLMGGRKV